MRFLIPIVCFLLSFSSCKNDKKSNFSSIKKEKGIPLNLKYAKGFQITQYSDFKVVTVTKTHPDSKDTLNYVLIDKIVATNIPSNDTVFIKTPIEKVVTMSTSNIPCLEYLGVENKLIGFPNTKYISSKKTRANIEKGIITDLNSNSDLNIELLLDINPELVIGFSVDGNDRTLTKIKNFGIPVVMDGAWTEQHPLGRAEWIKFMGAFFNKEKEADSIFNSIEHNYLEAKILAKNTSKKPTVFAGSLFKDVWNVPGGNSFIAKYFEDANTDYLWKNNDKTGSLHLNFENVLVKAQTADLWIGAGNYKTKKDMLNTHKGYELFNAFKSNTMYTYKKSHGNLFFELGPLRPDIILKDIIHIAHPEVDSNYELYFYENLE